MSGYNDVYWLESMTTFYRSMYLDVIRECTSLLEKYGRYEEVEQIMREALGNESLDEELHACFVRSLSMQGKQKLAMEQYRKSAKTLYEALETTKMESMQKEYERLMRQEHGARSSLEEIIRELCGDMEEGAFWCEFGVFKHIYRLERRRLKRCSASIFLILITVEPREEYLEQQKEEEFLAPVMKALQNVLMKVLRSGDVVARCSKSQYILMLPSCQYSSVKTITDRIERKLAGTLKTRDGIRIHYSTNEIR